MATSESSEEEGSDEESRASDATHGGDDVEAESANPDNNAANEARETQQSPPGSPESLSPHSSDYAYNPPNAEHAVEQAKV